MRYFPVGSAVTSHHTGCRARAGIYNQILQNDMCFIYLSNKALIFFRIVFDVFDSVNLVSPSSGAECGAQGQRCAGGSTPPQPTKTCYADSDQKKLLNANDIHETDTITSVKSFDRDCARNIAAPGPWCAVTTGLC